MGPVPPAVTRPPYQVRIVRGVRIGTAEPGATLAADLFLPSGAGRVPAVVTVLPYRKDVLGGAGCWDLLRWFARHGYAGVLVDVRGLGSSDGRPRPPFDPDEAEDGVAAVEWAARQPWCSGAVGMWGFSYGAALALRTATHRPEPLRAVVSVMGLLDPEHDFVHPSGARGCVAPLGVWGLGTLVNQLLPPLLDHHDATEQRRWRDRVEHAEPYLADACRHQPGDRVWRSRAIDATAITTPTLAVGGWRDMFCDAAVRIYEQVRGPRKLLLGPWMHSLPDDAPDEPVDARSLALRWWDRWLAGSRDGLDAEPPVTLYVQGWEPGWRHLPGWPPAGTRVTVSATVDGGLRGGGIPPGAGGQAGMSARRDPTVGPLSGLWGIPTGGFGGPLDQHDDDLRTIAFTGEPLAASLLLVGRPSVTLAAAAAGEAGRLVVKLTDVDPDGRSTLVTGGVLVPAAGTPSVTLQLDPTGYRFRAGHRLRVVVGDSAFPRLWPVPADSDQIRLRRLTLNLPTVAAGQEEPASVDRPGPPAGGETWIRDDPRWEIHRDPLHERVTVVVGNELRAVLPDSRHSFRQHTDIRATVGRDAAGAAGVRATSTAEVRLATGEQVVVRVELLLTREVAAATGAVSVDGVPVADRRWHVLVPADAGGDEGGQQEGAGAGGEAGVVAGDESLVVGAG